jgi:hypothetical protein
MNERLRRWLRDRGLDAEGQRRAQENIIGRLRQALHDADRENAQLREALRGFTKAVEGWPRGECFDRKSPTYLQARRALGDTPDE